MAQGINVPIGPAIVIYGDNMETTFDITKGGVTLAASTSIQEVKVDQHGESTVKSIIKGRTVQVTVPFAINDLEKLSKVVPNSTFLKNGSKSKLTVSSLSGYDMLSASKRLIVKPTDPNATENDWITIPLAGVIMDPEYTYNSDNERVAKVMFTGFVEQSNSSLYILGDTNMSTLIDDFSDDTLWITQSGTPDAKDTTYVQNGTASLRLTSNNGELTSTRKTVSLDVSKEKAFILRVYVEDASKLNYISFYFSSHPSMATYYTHTIRAANLVNGWNYLLLDKAQFTVSGAESWNNTMIRIQVRCVAGGGMTTSVVFDSISKKSLLPTNRPKVIFTMDDGWISQYTEAFTRLSAKGFKGSIAVIPSKVDTASYVSKAQLQEIYNAGWDLMNHTYTHVYLGQSTLATQQTEIDSTKQWLNDNGFRRASDIVVYPYGSYNSDTLNVMQNYRAGRTIADFVEQYVPYDIKLIKCRNLTPSVDISKAKAFVDEAINSNGVVVFLNHRFGDPAANGGDTMFYDPTIFQQLLDYVESKKDVLDVVTMSEWLNKK